MSKLWPPATVAGQPTCGTQHWSLAVACAQPRGHRDNWHSGWTGPSGTRGRKYYRWRRTIGGTELMVGKVWQPTSIPGPNGPQIEPGSADQPDRCSRCCCDDCGGSLTDHTGAGCGCEDCTAYPEYACTQFMPSKRIEHIAQQLGSLLSTHLGPRQQRRCLAVAHAAHHALHDYDYPEDTPR